MGTTAGGCWRATAELLAAGREGTDLERLAKAFGQCCSRLLLSEQQQDLDRRLLCRTGEAATRVQTTERRNGLRSCSWDCRCDEEESIRTPNFLPGETGCSIVGVVHRNKEQYHRETGKEVASFVGTIREGTLHTF